MTQEKNKKNRLTISDRYCNIVKRHLLERYRSGHNEAVLKTVCPKGRVGSNPTLSVNCSAELRWWVPGTELNIDSERNVIQPDAEVPKWLKGLPWKGSRSLVAARGFKSLLLRFEYLEELEKRTSKNLKKVVDKSEKLWYSNLAVARNDNKEPWKLNSM